MVLARFLPESGQRDQARHTLALVYDCFTEGFETADLKLDLNSDGLILGSPAS
jgi:hypothetical protein